MGDIYKEVGERVRAQRRLRSLTLEDLAELSGLHASYIGQIERGVKKCSLRTIAVLASSLGLVTGKLFQQGITLRSMGSLDAVVQSNNPAERQLVLDMVKLLAKRLRSQRK